MGRIYEIKIIKGGFASLNPPYGNGVWYDVVWIKARGRIHIYTG
jgi:hypothetical protein